MTAPVDDTIIRDLAEYAVQIFEARGRNGLVYHAVIEAAAQMNEGKRWPLTDDEKARAYNLAKVELGITSTPDGELHPDGERLHDRAIVAGLMGRLKS